MQPPYAFKTKKSIWISAVVVVAPVPFVTTMAKEPADAVLLLMLRAEPVVAPLMESITSVVEAVIEEFVNVRVKSAPAAMETDVKVALPDLPLTTTGEDATPEAWEEFKRIPVPTAVATKLPLVAVILPKVAVMLVPALTAPAVAETLPVVAVTPVPPVTVVPADTAPAVATMFPVVEVMPVPAVTVPLAERLPDEAVMLPVVAVIPVPAVTVVPAETDPAVAAIFPNVAVMLPVETTAFPVVTVKPVPAVRVVVVVKEPGVVIAEGKDTVATPATVVTVIWLAVPST
jgi:hypothetical protein